MHLIRIYYTYFNRDIVSLSLSPSLYACMHAGRERERERERGGERVSEYSMSPTDLYLTCVKCPGRLGEVGGSS